MVQNSNGSRKPDSPYITNPCSQSPVVSLAIRQRSRDLFTLPLETGIPETKGSIYIKWPRQAMFRFLNGPDHSKRNKMADHPHSERVQYLSPHCSWLFRSPLFSFPQCIIVARNGAEVRILQSCEECGCGSSASACRLKIRTSALSFSAHFESKFAHSC